MYDAGGLSRRWFAKIVVFGFSSHKLTLAYASKRAINSVVLMLPFSPENLGSLPSNPALEGTMCFVPAIASGVRDLVSTSWAVEDSCASCISLIVFNTPKCSGPAIWHLFYCFMTSFPFGIVKRLIRYFAFVVILQILSDVYTVVYPFLAGTK